MTDNREKWEALLLTVSAIGFYVVIFGCAFIEGPKHFGSYNLTNDSTEYCNNVRGYENFSGLLNSSECYFKVIDFNKDTNTTECMIGYESTLFVC